MELSAKISSPSSSSSSSIVASNVDLLTQILVRLPGKPLLVFKSVSKDWYSLISNPTFIINHFIFRKTLPTSLILLQMPCYRYINFVEGRDVNGINSLTDFTPFNALPFGNRGIFVKSRISRSVNGLLLCLSSPNLYHWHGHIEFYIFNPTTKQYKILPPLSSTRIETYYGSIEMRYKDTICMASLAFDPLISPHYQVVFIAIREREYYPRSCYIEIYSSKTSSWRICETSFRGHADTFIIAGVFWNGNLHWINSFLDESRALYFDLEQEVVKKMPLPPILPGEYKGRIGYFGECKGHMYLVRVCNERDTLLDVFEMETHYVGWKFRYHVNLESLTTSYPSIVEDMTMSLNDFHITVFLVEEENKEERSPQMIFRVGHDNVFCCDINKMSFKKLPDIEPNPEAVRYCDPFPYHWSHAHQYIESLTSV